jgi:hypothetical protein
MCKECGCGFSGETSAPEAHEHPGHEGRQTHEHGVSALAPGRSLLEKTSGWLSFFHAKQPLVLLFSQLKQDHAKRV